MDSADRNSGAGNYHQPARPPRPPARPAVSQRTYWIRRTVALLILVAVGVLAVWGVKAIVGLFASDAKGKQAEQPKDTPAPPDPNKETKDGAKGTDKTADDKADKDSSGPKACDPASLSFVLSAANTQFSVAKANTFSVVTTSNGEQPCTLDAGLAARPVTVYSGEDRIWSSADCDEKGARMLLLSKDVKDTATIEWDMVRSDDKCTPDLAKAKPGTYRAVIEGSAVQSEPYVFNVVP